MIEISKSWSQLKNILTYNNLYFDFDDSDDGSRRVIYCQRNAYIVYVCGMDLVENPAQGSDQFDFEQNWMAKAGEKKYIYYSKAFDVVLTDGLFIADFKLKANDETTDVEAFLYQGSLDIGEGAVRGDSIEVQVIDLDNVLGHGYGTVLGWVVRKKILSGAQFVRIRPPQYDFLSSKRKLPQGVYLRLRYIGQGEPSIIADYEYEY
jgi:hypothetical protein